jgi:hypothetical protein
MMDRNTLPTLKEGRLPGLVQQVNEGKIEGRIE